MEISAHILKIVEMDPFFKASNESLRKGLIDTNFFHKNQYMKIKLMQNETNRWSIFL